MGRYQTAAQPKASPAQLEAVRESHSAAGIQSGAAEPTASASTPKIMSADNPQYRIAGGPKRPEPMYAAKLGKGVLWIPMWTGKFYQLPDGSLKPEVVHVACGESINSGKGCDFYSRKKGYKRVEEIPDEFADFKRPLIEAKKALVAKEIRRINLIKEQVDLGLAKPDMATVPEAWLGVLSEYNHG